MYQHLTMKSTLTGAIPAPGLLRSFYDRSNEYAELGSKSSQMASKGEIEEYNPTYKTRYASQHWPLSVHRNKEKARAKFVERSYQYHCYWLNRTMTLSFCLSTGAGGFSIAPVLRIQALLGRSSWVCLKLCSFFSFDHLCIPLFDGNLDKLVREFQHAFSNGTTTPSDLVSYGGFASESGYSLVDVGHSTYLIKYMTLTYSVFHTRACRTGTS